MKGIRTLAAAVSLSVLAGLAAFPLTASGAESRSVDPATGTVTMYEWRRIDNMWGIPQFGNSSSKNGDVLRLLISWGDKGYYMSGGDTMNEDGDEYYAQNCIENDKYMSMSDSFVTGDLRNVPYLIYCGTDSDNPPSSVSSDHFPKYYIALANSDGSQSSTYAYQHWGGNDYLQWRSDGDKDDWTLIAGGPWKDEDTVGYCGTELGTVKLIHNKSLATDTGWFYSGNTLFGSNSFSKSNNNDKYYNSRWLYSKFVAYVPSEKQFSAMTKDYTIQSGQTWNSQDNVFIDDGVTLTVEEGAVLSVNGRLFNNGTIINHGTIVLQQGASISPFEPQRSDSGTITCDGGDIVMLSGSRLYTERERGGLTLQNSSTLVNCGAVITGSYLVMDDSVIDNRSGGSLFFGFEVKHNMADLPSETVTFNSEGAYMSCLETGGMSQYQKLNVAKYGITLRNGSRIENEGAAMLRCGQYLSGDSTIVGSGIVGEY